MNKRLKVAQFGMGPIGTECLKLVATRSWARVVGAIDIDPNKVGGNLGEWTGMKNLKHLDIVSSVGAMEEQPDVIFHTSVSKFRVAFDQIAPLVTRGINVVSSCEELVFPQLNHGPLAKRLDAVARRAGGRVLGTGVNPGFVMDLLPICLTGVAQNVKEIRVERVVDAATRRGPLQKKIGSGLAPARFRSLLKAGKAGHAGLKESLALIAHALGHKVRTLSESGDAVVASRDIETVHVHVRRGQTCGLHQTVEARIAKTLRLSLDLKMYLQAPNTYDRVLLNGEPSIELLIPGGIQGDAATVAALVNSVPRLMRTTPGLKLLTDLPLV